MIRFILKQVILCSGLFWCFSVLGVTKSPYLKAPSEPLRYNPTVSGNWYPYYNSDNPSRPGILAELIPLIMAKAGVPIERISLPPRRSAWALQQGALDFEVVSSEWLAGKSVGEGFVGSQPLMPVSEYFITLPRYQHMAGQGDWIYAQAVGTVGGYYYHDDDVFKRMDVPSEKQIVMGLDKGRFKVGILELHAARYWARKLQIPIVIGKLHSHGELILRLRKEHSIHLPQINRAIAELKQQGTFAQISQKYLLL